MRASSRSSWPPASPGRRSRARIVWHKNQIRFTNGAVIHLCHCQYEKDVVGYQGAELHVLRVDAEDQPARVEVFVWPADAERVQTESARETA